MFTYKVYMVKALITIRDDQAKWLRKKYMKLSPFVRDKLDEAMKKEKDET